MNRFLASRYDEKIQRLALGIEPLDAMRGGRIPFPVEISLDDRSARVPRHETCVHALLYAPDTESPVDIRLVDRTRRYVPRRLRIPIPARAAIEAGELPPGPAPVPAAHRIRRPALHPGAAYDVSESVTGMRGRVLRGGEPMRWARVTARLTTAAATIVGTAHGDDRGEFLLVLARNPSSLAALGTEMTVRITVFGPAAPPVPATPDLPRVDPLWDLPLEVAPAPGAADPVMPGTQPPPGYTHSVNRSVTLPLGRIASDFAPFTL